MSFSRRGGRGGGGLEGMMVRETEGICWRVKVEGQGRLTGPLTDPGTPGSLSI